MASNKDFNRAWYRWLRVPLPTLNFRQGHANATTYGIELDLDHTASYVRRLGQGVIEQTAWDYIKLASQELNVINKIEQELENSTVPEIEKQMFKNYIAATRLLLEEIVELPSAKDTESVPTK